MKPMYIELFVDRLCGMFPRDNIARNTVKSAWIRDDFFLLNTQEEEVKAALTILENDKAFPSLARAKEVFRSIRKAAVDSSPTCDTCDNTGWDGGSRWEQQGDDPENFVMTQDFHRQVGLLGDTSTYVVKCPDCSMAMV
jgi:hypothetical protein